MSIVPVNRQSAEQKGQQVQGFQAKGPKTGRPGGGPPPEVLQIQSLEAEIESLPPGPARDAKERELETLQSTLAAKSLARMAKSNPRFAGIRLPPNGLTGQGNPRQA